MRERLRFVWLEQRDRDRLQLLCVKFPMSSAEAAEVAGTDLMKLRADRVAVLPKRLHSKAAGLCMDAIAFVPDELLDAALELLRRGFRLA